MNQPLQAHDLHSEFPEFNDRIHALKLNDNHFSRLFTEYHDVNKEVQRIEVEATAAVSDEHMEELKKNRLALKDALYKILIEYKN